MTTAPCPTCGHRWSGNTRRRTQLAGVGTEWREVAVGSSRWHVHALRRQHPGYEFRAERIGTDAWRIEARRRP